MKPGSKTVKNYAIFQKFSENKEKTIFKHCLAFQGKKSVIKI